MSEFAYNLDLLLRKAEEKRLTPEDKLELHTALIIDRIRRNSQSSGSARSRRDFSPCTGNIGLIVRW